jgi:hypothetical protein
MILNAMIIIERNDDDGVVPTASEAAAVLQDVLADTTRHDRELGWRVTLVTAVSATEEV